MHEKYVEMLNNANFTKSLMKPKLAAAPKCISNASDFSA